MRGIPALRPDSTTPRWLLVAYQMHGRSSVEPYGSTVPLAGRRGARSRCQSVLWQLSAAGSRILGHPFADFGTAPIVPVTEAGLVLADCLACQPMQLERSTV